MKSDHSADSEAAVPTLTSTEPAPKPALASAEPHSEALPEVSSVPLRRRVKQSARRPDCHEPRTCFQWETPQSSGMGMHGAS